MESESENKWISHKSFSQLNLLIWKKDWNLDFDEHRKVKQIIKSQNFKTLRLNPRTYKGVRVGGGWWLAVGDFV